MLVKSNDAISRVCCISVEALLEKGFALFLAKKVPETNVEKSNLVRYAVEGRTLLHS